MGPGRSLAVLVLVVSTIAGVSACGGTSIRRGDPDDGGTGGTSAGGSGGSAKGGAGGTKASGGAAASGGSAAASGGSAGSAATGGTTGCVVPPCVPIECPDGQLIQRECSCPVCSCENVACVSSDCPAGQVPTRLPGACCDTCIDAPPLPGCEAVMCLGEQDCGSGYVWDRVAGACCASCVPTEPVACPEIVCPPDLECPPGYIAGDGASTGCCFECVADPDYCRSDADCLLAKHVPDCCGCLRAISERHYEADLCFSALGEMRAVPPECGTPSDCDGECLCPVADEAWCVNGTCSEIELDLK